MAEARVAVLIGSLSVGFPVIIISIASRRMHRGLRLSQPILVH